MSAIEKAASPSLKEFDRDQWVAAQRDMLGGKFHRGMTRYAELLKRFPDMAELWFEYGVAASRALEFEEAGRAFQRTMELAQGDAGLLILVGQQHHHLQWMDQARECFKKALEGNPGSIKARLSMVEWLDLEGKPQEALEILQPLLEDHPVDGQVQCLHGKMKAHLGKLDEAETIFRGALESSRTNLPSRQACHHELALVLDKTMRHEEALKNLEEAKAILCRIQPVKRLQDVYDQFDRRRRETLDEIKAGMIRCWTEEGRGKEKTEEQVILLAGHPRSGTTLLEQILGAHPRVLAHDEPPAFGQEVLESLSPMEGGTRLSAQGLDSLSPSRRSFFRERYFKSLARGRALKPGAPVLHLDKNPSYTGALHLWLRLFPRSKIIVALRDPRDVLVSCYFQNLNLNAISSNYTGWERLLKHYCDLMDVWLKLREMGGFEWRESPYEGLVANPDAEGRRMTGFMGLDWDSMQSRFYETSGSRLVVSPNRAAVAQPVHQKAVSRWRFYRQALAPLQARLAPYCRAFGYEPGD